MAAKKRPKVRGAKEVTDARTEGQRLLRGLLAGDHSLATIGAACGVSRQVAGRWSTGEKLPGADARVALARLGVPLASWEVPAGQPKTVASVTSRAVTRRVSTIEQVDEQIADIDDMLGDGLLVSDQTKLIAAKVQLLNTRARIEEHGRRYEADVVAKTSWCRRVVEVLSKTLARWPDAAEAVALVLEAEGLDTP